MCVWQAGVSKNWHIWLTEEGCYGEEIRWVGEAASDQARDHKVKAEGPEEGRVGISVNQEEAHSKFRYEIYKWARGSQPVA